MSNLTHGIKLILETHEGERVERDLNGTIWSTDGTLDAAALHSTELANTIKDVTTEMVMTAITPDLIKDMLTELVERKLGRSRGVK